MFIDETRASRVSFHMLGKVFFLAESGAEKSVFYRL